MRVDTQVHVVSRDLDSYPLNPPSMDVPRWFELHGRTVEELLVEMDAAGIDRAVLVQGFSAYQYDNRYTADAAATRPDRLAGSCIVDVEDDPITAIRHWVGAKGARGIRLFLQRSDAAWLATLSCDAVCDELLRLGAVAQFAVNATQLGAVALVARRHRDLPMLIDHCGFPDLSGGHTLPNARPLLALADEPNVRVKLSAHVLDSAVEAGADPRAVATRIVRTFGAERVMWASDLTVHARSYRELIADAEQAFADLTESERALVLGDAAAALWWPVAPDAPEAILTSS